MHHADYTIYALAMILSLTTLPGLIGAAERL